MTSSESQPRTRASREALAWIGRTEKVDDPAGNTIYDEMRLNFLPRIEAEAAQDSPVDVERLAPLVKDEIHRVFCLNAKHRSPFTGLCRGDAAHNIARGLVARLAEEPHD